MKVNLFYGGLNFWNVEFTKETAFYEIEVWKGRELIFSIDLCKFRLKFKGVNGRSDTKEYTLIEIGGRK